ncbi:MAG: type IV secretion protein Rhs [Flavobacteriaceae bacterium]|nr:MAG: type IV secretion protein Rhs [Flavobacteriaceae bacterium]
MKNKNLLMLMFLMLIAVVVDAQTKKNIVKENYTVLGSSTLEATESIVLKPTTWIKYGSNFTAKIVEESNLFPYSKPQFSNQNYIYTQTFQIATKTGNISYTKDVIEQITYFDGLGRPMQQIGIGQSPEAEDIVTHIDYDRIGRQDKDYLPYVPTVGANGLYKTDALTATKGFYKTPKYDNTANPYSQKQFEASPLNRVLQQAAPGNVWALGSNHEIKFDYNTNTVTEVALFEVSLDGNYIPTLSKKGNYSASQLYKNIVKDENWTTGNKHTTQEFKNKQGQVVLKRTFDNQPHDTFYIYDDYGNLTYVLPPLANGQANSISTTALKNLCYQYRYDYRNRLIEKQMPGKEREYIVYDLLDRPVLTQDAIQKSKNEWLFTKYDVFGRVAYTGIFGSSLNRAVQQTQFNAKKGISNKNYETRISANPYYTNVNYPTSGLEILSINYYDNYDDFTTVKTITYDSNTKTSTTRTKGLATGSKVKVLTTDKWITSISYYDDKARPVYIKSVNDYLNTVDVVESTLDFVGKVEKSKTIHKKIGKPYIVTVDIFKYDHTGRLLTQQKRINNQASETIASNMYDKLGALKSKKVGGGLQDIIYKYNIRGWLTDINDVANTNKLFNFHIGYTEGANPLFNGNINQTKWRTNNIDDSSLKTYSYTYDALNRITSGIDNTADKRYSLTGITYDKNGNITTLLRKGHTNNGIPSFTFGTMDNLVYTYDTNSNRLKKVLDNGNDNEGFKDGVNQTTEFTYDLNGNLISDANKGVTSVLYNYLNMPTKITVIGANAGVLDYVYSADGTKLQKIKTVGTNVTTTDYAGNYVYENNILKQFNQPEGYVEPKGSGWQYVYRLTDIWGNTRITFADDDNNGSVNSSEIRREQNYYPFGLEHKGYNNSMYGAKNNLKTYQKQEFTEDLGLNTHEWRYRISDPAIGRFWQIDPLAEDYMYNSTYAFAENKLGMGVELEGLEIVSWDFLIASGTTHSQSNPNGAIAHATGYVSGVKSSVEGTVNAIMNPAQTLGGIGNLLVAGALGGNTGMMLQADAALGTNSLGTAEALGEAISQGATDVISGNGLERGAVVGNVVTAALGAKGTNIALKGASAVLKTTPLATRSVTAANGVKVSGFTKHGLNQKMNRGVKSSSVLDAVKNPLKTGGVKVDRVGRPSQRFTGAKAEVAVNPQTGKVVSTNPTSTKKAARLKRQQEQ